MAHPLRRSLFYSATLCVAAFAASLAGADPGLVERALATQRAESMSPLGETAGMPDLETPCADGVVKDDASVETGYGWVPSAVEGIYVQTYHTAELPTATVDEVCVCFLRTGSDPSIDFEVVFYRSFPFPGYGPIPEEQPFAVVPASLEDVPEGIVGKFASVATPNVKLSPLQTFYVGVRWNPSQHPGFFVCDDTNEATQRVEIFFRDDRAKGWATSELTNDYIFDIHRALLVRPVSRLVATDVPDLGRTGWIALALLLAAVALRRLVR